MTVFSISDWSNFSIDENFTLNFVYRIGPPGLFYSVLEFNRAETKAQFSDIPRGRLEPRQEKNAD